ncbi:N-methylglutamate dehydrogenase subunit C [Rhizobium sp. RU20A]|uniref:sarcosine oxidase subunit alpha family protein n=1 Tax=Rhizobium sp. RU20A TaxID=1907412 RepID=UPI000955566B|nr:sarcosine oxidase subunit alpha family protein [Rhizobium sp. RU20A]SIQ98486.1 N-methylglutamate dehydrogenase subunit C [Rhizobium sp. RU20A]
MTPFRLPAGGRIDRSHKIGFSFDGRAYYGHAGDTLASALLANGVSLMARSFKYHRPRGPVTAGASEPNALVTIGTGGRTEPNTRATVAELYEGLDAVSQNRWPSLSFDIGSVNSLLSPVLGAGFYYKTFMWPAAFWEKVYEPLIRKAAGLGRATYEADPDSYEKCWAHCDLLVIGGGAAGLSAAVTAARAGARVIVADEQAEMGGWLLSESGVIDGTLAATVLAGLLFELEGHPNVTLLSRSTVFGWYDDGVFGAVERVQKHVPRIDANRPVERLWRIAARHAILATGAEERPLVFGGNDIPGVMTASAMRTWLTRYGVAAGKNPAIFANDDSAYALAADLEAAGMAVAAIVDPRADGGRDWTGRAEVLRGAVVTDAHGGKAVEAISVRVNGTLRKIAADALAMAGGFSPVIHLSCHRGAKPVWSEEKAAFLAPSGLDGLTVAGGAAALRGLGAVMADGAAKAASVLAAIGFAGTPAFASAPEEGGAAKPLWSVPGTKGKAFVDYQNDVHTKDLGLAVREGYGHVELAKRYTTNGMATDQGKLGNVNAIGILAEARGVSPAEVGTTTFRPFYTPVSFGALAGTSRGKHFQPVRQSPLHGWAKRNGATFVETGLWYRSAWFPRAGETTWRESVDREVTTTRSAAGLCDVSTLGKIEITGRDAATFLDRVYCNGFAKLPVGKARYGLMLREDGFIYDDGTTSRLEENRYFMTTTTAYAAGVMAHLEFCAQALWPELDVRFASVTDEWAQMAIAGPKSREILSAIVDADLSDAAMPFLGAKTVTLGGGAIEARLFRISFSGELAYELAVPAGYGEAVADAIMEAGRVHGICAYGVEALAVMRIEKGHVTHNEINGTVVPADLGFGRMVSATKADFIGRAMLAREGLTDLDRPRLVGVKPVDPKDGFRTGSHILAEGAEATLENDQGYVSSSCYSPSLGHTIGLALVKRGPERLGERVQIWNSLRGEFTMGVLTSPVFIDPDNARLHG